MDAFSNLSGCFGCDSTDEKTDSNDSHVPDFPRITWAIPQAIQALAIHRGGAHWDWRSGEWRVAMASRWLEPYRWNQRSSSPKSRLEPPVNLYFFLLAVKPWVCWCRKLTVSMAVLLIALICNTHSSTSYKCDVVMLSDSVNIVLGEDPTAEVEEAGRVAANWWALTGTNLTYNYECLNDGQEWAGGSNS